MFIIFLNFVLISLYCIKFFIQDGDYFIFHFTIFGDCLLFDSFYTKINCVKNFKNSSSSFETESNLFP